MSWPRQLNVEQFVMVQRFQDGKSVPFKKKAVADKDIDLRVNGHQHDVFDATRKFEADAEVALRKLIRGPVWPI